MTSSPSIDAFLINEMHEITKIWNKYSLDLKGIDLSITFDLLIKSLGENWDKIIGWTEREQNGDKSVPRHYYYIRLFKHRRR